MRYFHFVLLSISFWTNGLLGQPPIMVKNINQSFGVSSSPQNLTNVNGELFFSADNGLVGFELWKSDGTTSGTKLVKDLTPGSASTDNLRDFIEVNNKLFFSCRTGTELWTSDGTLAGTDTLITFSSIGTILDESFVDLNGNLIFVTREFATGNLSLWKSSGTAATTQHIKTFNGGGNSIHPRSFTIYQNDLYFLASDGISGQEVWKTNGTVSGTILLKDINPGTNDGTPWPNPPFFNEVNGQLYFIGNDGVSGDELWRTNGSNIGTILVKDINSGIGSADITSPTIVGNHLYFKVFIGGRTSLWKSNGTSSGTIKITDLSRNDYMIALDSTTLIFNQDNTTPIDYGRELWITHGTPSSTGILKDIYPGNLHGLPVNHFKGIVIDSILYFNAQDSAHGLELWRSNGTDSGTFLVKDMNPGLENGFLNNSKFLFDANGRLFLDAISFGGGSSTELWKSDGTDTGTVRLNIDTNGGGSIPFNCTLIDTTLFLTANNGFSGIELYSVLADSIKKKKTVVIGPPSSIEEREHNLEINFYPNPTNSFITVDVKTKSKDWEGMNVLLLNLEGKMIYSNYHKNKHMTLDLSKCENGIYFLLLSSKSNELVRKKIIKY